MSIEESITSLRAEMQKLHDSRVNHTYSWRLDQLCRMERMLKEHRDEFIGALQKDLGNATVEACLLHFEQVNVDLNTIRSLYLREYTRRKRVASTLLLVPSRCELIPCPLNGPAVLVIGPSNYPLSLCLQPAVGALAAGNPVVIKPSEHCPSVSEVLERYVHEYFEPNAVRVVLGEIPEATILLQKPWGKIFFTGSPAVGSIVAQMAAKTLTPTVLELGGKCPCVVDPETCDNGHLDLTLIANRILWAKFMNAGQTCAAVDTLIVSANMLDQLLPHLLESLYKQYGSDGSALDSKQSKMGRIITKRAAQRLFTLLEQVEQHIAIQTEKQNTQAEPGNETKEDVSDDDTDNTKCRILFGGTKYCNVEEKFIAPTIVINPPPDCDLMRDEIFGPILVIVTIQTREQIIQYIRTTMHSHTTPLCLYVFTSSDKVYREYISSIRAGSVMRNDCFVMLSSPHIPFGGLGTSGYGTYHGKFSLECFTQWLPSMYRPLLPGSDLDMIRYPPFIKGSWKEWFLTKVATKLPDIPVLYLPEMAYISVLVAIVAVAATTWIIRFDSSTEN